MKYESWNKLQMQKGEIKIKNWNLQKKIRKNGTLLFLAFFPSLTRPPFLCILFPLASNFEYCWQSTSSVGPAMTIV